MIALYVLIIVVILVVVAIYFFMTRTEYFGWDDINWYEPSAGNCLKDLFGRVDCLPLDVKDRLQYFVLRHTKGQTYDPRGEPAIQKRNFIWNNSDRMIPYIYNIN